MKKPAGEQAAKRHGKSIEHLADGAVHEGRYKQGQRQGKWVLRSANGDVHEGPYVDGNPHGQWAIRPADGSVHKGSMVQGKPHGQWIGRLSVGDVFKVRFEEGRQRGDPVPQGGDKAGAKFINWAAEKPFTFGLALAAIFETWAACIGGHPLFGPRFPAECVLLMRGFICYRIRFRT